MRNQLAAFHLRFYGERVEPDAPEIDGLYQLFVDSRISDAPRSWKTTLTAMLQDVRIAYY